MEGLKNNLFKQEHVEEVYEERLEICKKCPFYDPEGKSKGAVVKGSPSCSSCGCPMATKLRALSTNCPEGLWSAVMDEDLEDKVKDQIDKDDNN